MSRQRFDRLVEPGRSVVSSLLGALPLVAPARAQLAESKPTLVASPRGVELSGNLSLIFEVNWGQTDPQVKFLSQGRGYTLFLTPGEMVLGLTKPDESQAVANAHARNE